MSCLHPYSDSFVQLRSRWIVSCLVLFLVSWDVEGDQNVDLEFPVFNSSFFTCTGIPAILGYAYCWFNNSGENVDVLPSVYNNLYPNQAARVMYNAPIMFANAGGNIQASFSTFFVFSVSHVANQLNMGAGFAFLVAPQTDTPPNSANGGFGLFPMNASTGRSSSTPPQVLAVEFDTSFTPGIDIVDVPHIGIDIDNLGGQTGNNATLVSEELLDKTLGMWIDYNTTLNTLDVYCTAVNATDGSAASLKPATPVVSMSAPDLPISVNRRSYVGFGAGVYGGGFEDNVVYYWAFQTFGFPPESVIAQWYQWWAPLSTTKKIGLVAGAVVGTVGGAYLCSECLFFCFFKRIKNPQTPAEERWPVRRRKSLPGTRTKKEPPRKKVRDSFSVANPLYLWGTPLEPAEDPDDGSDGELNRKSPTSEGIPESDSSTEETPLMSPPGIDGDDQLESEVEAIEDVEAPPQRLDQRSKPASKHREKSPRYPAPAQKGGPAPRKGVQASPTEERTSASPAKRKPEPKIAKPLSPTAPIQNKPLQVENRGPAPIAKQIEAPQAPRRSVKVVQVEKRSSPPKQRSPQAAGEKKVDPQGGKPSSSPQQRRSQAQGESKNVAVQPGGKRTSPPKQRPAQGGRNGIPEKLATQQATKTPSPQKPLPGGTKAAAAHKSPGPKERRPSHLPKKEPPKEPRPSPQTSPPRAVPRRSSQTSPKVEQRPRPKSPPKKSL